MDSDRLNRLLRDLSAIGDVRSEPEPLAPPPGPAATAFRASAQQRGRSFLLRRVRKPGPPEPSVHEALAALSKQIQDGATRRGARTAQRVVEQLERRGSVAPAGPHPPEDALLACAARDPDAIKTHSMHLASCTACRQTLYRYERHAGLIETTVVQGDDVRTPDDDRLGGWDRILALRNRITALEVGLTARLLDAVQNRLIERIIDLLEGTARALHEVSDILDRLPPDDRAGLERLNATLDSLESVTEG